MIKLQTFNYYILKTKGTVISARLVSQTETTYGFRAEDDTIFRVLKSTFNSKYKVLEDLGNPDRNRRLTSEDYAKMMM